MTRKQYETQIAVTLFPNVNVVALNDMITTNGGLLNLIERKDVFVTVEQKLSVKALLEFYDSLEIEVVMEKVTSSNVDSLGYDPVSKTLYVTYKSGGEYSYKGVPKEVFDNLRLAPSIGKAIYAIKSTYEATKLN